MKKILKRGMSGLLAVLMAFTVLAGFGTTTAFAASETAESYTFALAEKNHWQVKTVRMVLDVILVGTGVLLGGKFGVCTIITVMISGPVIQFVNEKSKRFFNL